MAMATYNTPKRTGRFFGRLRSALLITGQALLLLTIAATGYAYIVIADALINAPQPTERCVSTAWGEQVCRQQRRWQ